MYSQASGHHLARGDARPPQCAAHHRGPHPGAQRPLISDDQKLLTTDCAAQLPGVEEVKDLHVWHLSQSLICASLSIVTPAVTLEEWARIEASIRHCFDEFGISHVVVAPYRREQVAAAMAAAAELRRKQQQNGEEQDAEAEAENAEAAQEAEGGATPPAAAP